MTYFLLRLGFVLLGCCAIVSAAQAQDAYSNTGEACTVPRSFSVSPDGGDRWKYCDIHIRRFAYQEEAARLRDEMIVRSENFQAIRKAVQDNYDAELERYHAEMIPGR